MEYIFEWLVNEIELRTWMDAEMSRLGEWFRNFTITWHRNESRHWLEVWSESKSTMMRGGEPVGKCCCVGEVNCNEDWIAVPLIQKEGRWLYYRLRKLYPVVRDLGMV